MIKVNKNDTKTAPGVALVFIVKLEHISPVDTERKLNVHKTFRRRPLNVLCTFNLYPVSTGSHLVLVVLLLTLSSSLPAGQRTPTKNFCFPNPYRTNNSLKNFSIRSLFGPHFLAFRRNTKIYSVHLCTKSECRKTRTRKTAYKDTLQL